MKPVIMYIDPSVATYAIQAIAAIVIVGGAVVTSKIRKMKKKVDEKLNIDDNRNKEVEEEIKEVE